MKPLKRRNRDASSAHIGRTMVFLLPVHEADNLSQDNCDFFLASVAVLGLCPAAETKLLTAG